MTTWADPLDSEHALDGSTGGPALTGDPVADCQQYQQLSGKPAIVDPVAFTAARRSSSSPVGRRRPMARRSYPIPLTGRPRFGLDAALGDWVDGGRSQCFTKANAVPYMEDEIAPPGPGPGGPPR